MAEPRPIGSSTNIDKYLKERFIYILKSRVLPISLKNSFSKLDRNDKIKEDRRNPLNRLCCTRKSDGKSVCHYCNLFLNLPACKYVFHSERKLIEHLIGQEKTIEAHIVLSETEMKTLYPSLDQPQIRQTSTAEASCESNPKLPDTLSNQAIVFVF